MTDDAERLNKKFADFVGQQPGRTDPLPEKKKRGPRKPTSWLDRPIEKAKRKPGRPLGRKNRPKENRAPIEPAPSLVPPASTPNMFWRDRPNPSGDVIADWIERKCYVPEGKLLGQKFILAGWQKAELRRIYDNPYGTRRAILSFGRKNGKTSLAALLLLVHLIGPKARPNSQLFSAAQSRDQAALIFALAAKIVRMSPALHGVVQIRESTKELICPDLGTHYRALSAEASTAFGLSPVFVVHDEIGQVRGPRSALYEALETATGAQENPLSVIISTQAPTDADLLSVLIDDALAGHDKRTVVKLYTAPLTADPFDEETIKLANPAFGNFLNAVEVMAMADDARRMPSRESEYRNLLLNQRVEACQQFIQPAQWQRCEGELGDLTQCKDIYAGLDLSEANDLTALVLIGKIAGKWHVRPYFWLPADGLADRARGDRVPYDRWYKEGYLELVEGNSITYDKVVTRLSQIFAVYKPTKIAFDRWNYRHLVPWLLLNGWNEITLKERWVEFGQGTVSMSPALRELESRILECELVHGGHPILNMCMSNAVVDTVDSSNRKLSKKRSTGRIDGAVALAMAMGVAPLAAPKIDVEALIG